jgi:hypothetical protein
MDISNADLPLPQNLTPATEPAAENQAQTRAGVPESKEAGKHEQKNYESEHSEVSRKSAQAVSATLSQARHAEKQEETAEEPGIRKQSEQELQLFDSKGRLTGNKDPKLVDIVL